ncbi:hypothetical protein [Mycobacterium sp. AZCC_0083]|uniref:hypothetical protein n=1 Tax=Mycobacterium sp. AZCC_0083 TaxID=2735882 RepID=UPI001622D89C|nr:hypothetical protein [Mycobacterium sp. AZCC_0083]MBB5167615.1 hypothetical protein [Mycobacterium sp. AZCC_0083]
MNQSAAADVDYLMEAGSDHRDPDSDGGVPWVPHWHKRFRPPSRIPPGVWRVLSKAGYFIGLIGVVGGTFLYLVVLRPVLSQRLVDDSGCAVLEHKFALLLASAGAFFLVASYLQLAGVIARGKGPAHARISYGHALSPAAIGRYVTAPGTSSHWISPGAMAGIQYGLWVLAAIVLMLLCSAWCSAEATWFPRAPRRPPASQWLDTSPTKLSIGRRTARQDNPVQRFPSDPTASCAGTDSTVLQRWTVRYRMDPTSFTVKQHDSSVSFITAREACC